MNAFFDDHGDVDESLRDSDAPPQKHSKKDVELEPEKPPSVNCVQPPVLTSTYTDCDSKQDKCVVVLALFSGVKGINIDVIVKDGGPEQTLLVTYNWPISMYDVSSMFKKDGGGRALAEIGDPIVQAIEKELKKYPPVATIKVKLPVEVNCDPSSWKKMFNKKADGGVIVFLEFDCIRKEYAISKDEKYLKINSNKPTILY